MDLDSSPYDGEDPEMQDCIIPESVESTDPQNSASRPPRPTTLTALNMSSTKHTSSTHSSLSQFSMVTPLHSPPAHQEVIIPSSSSLKPIIMVTDTQQLPTIPDMAEGDDSSSVKPQEVHKVRSVSQLKSRLSLSDWMKEASSSWMVYNGYGELVTIEQNLKPIVAEELTVIQALRHVYKTYHAEVSYKFPRN